MIDICCVINGHREGYMAYATIQSALKTIRYAQQNGLTVQLLAILDKPDAITRKVFSTYLGEEHQVEEVSYGDLSESRNHAVNLLEAKYVAFLDGDDLWGTNWLVDSFLLAETLDGKFVLHPEYNLIFGCVESHIFKHVDMNCEDFELEDLYLRNYWTALSFAPRDLYISFPYKKNTIKEGFGYEDWTWNFDTIRAGVVHHAVKGTAHYIRKGKDEGSLLEYTNKMAAVPRIHNIYLNNSPLKAA